MIKLQLWDVKPHSKIATIAIKLLLWEIAISQLWNIVTFWDIKSQLQQMYNFKVKILRCKIII